MVPPTVPPPPAKGGDETGKDGKKAADGAPNGTVDEEAPLDPALEMANQAS